MFGFLVGAKIDIAHVTADFVRILLDATLTFAQKLGNFGIRLVIIVDERGHD